MAKFTPGPWTLVDVPSGWTVKVNDGKGTDYIADVHMHCIPGSDATSEANARLIAAAPTLAAACISMLTTAGSHYYWNDATRDSLLLIETALDEAGMSEDALAAIANGER